MHIIYGFDMGKDIAHFKLMPDEVKKSAESNAADVIYESFIVTGDQDYVTSRLLAQNGLPRGFYWAAAQAIEKWLKAILLMNGECVIGFKNHSLSKLLEAAIKIDTSIADLNILPHQSIRIDPSISRHLKRFTVHEFIKELDKHGCADNRYNAIGVDYNTGHLLAMDSFSFQLRMRVGAIPITENFNKLSPDLKVSFERNNPWFHNGVDDSFNHIPRDELPIELSMKVTKFEILSKHKTNPAYQIALTWLNKKMKLPSNERKKSQ